MANFLAKDSGQIIGLTNNIIKAATAEVQN
jgi:hypothetical protein